MEERKENRKTYEINIVCVRFCKESRRIAACND